MRGGANCAPRPGRCPDADEVLALPRQRLDHAAAGLVRGLRANAHIHHVSFSRIGARLNAHLLRSNVERRRERYRGLALRLRAGVAANIEVHRTRLARERERVATSPNGRAGGAQSGRVRQARAERGAQLFAAFSYRGVLARGFALVRDAADRPLRNVAAIGAGMAIEIEFADGRVGARAETAPEPTGQPTQSDDTPTKTRGRRGGGPGQGTLF